MHIEAQNIVVTGHKYVQRHPLLRCKLCSVKILETISGMNAGGEVLHIALMMSSSSLVYFGA